MECEPSDIVRGGDFYYHSTECELSDIVTGDDFFARLWNVNPLALYFENDVRLFLSQVFECSKGCTIYFGNTKLNTLDSVP